MALLWFGLLILWGVLVGFSAVPTVAWLLLIPFAAQDYYDTNRKKR